MLKNDTTGYDLYVNNTINVSVLTPKDWKTKVNIGGEYTIKEPGL